MIIGTARFTFRIHEASSLKDKRRVLKSLITRIKSKYNVSVAEIGYQDLWQKAEIGVAVVAVDTPHADSQLQSVLKFIEGDMTVEVIGVNTEIL